LQSGACRAFPDPQRNDLATGRAPSRSDGRRNFQILDPLDYFAEFTQHPTNALLFIRYYGYYSNKARGMRREAAAAILPLMHPVRHITAIAVQSDKP